MLGERAHGNDGTVYPYYRIAHIPSETTINSGQTETINFDPNTGTGYEEWMNDGNSKFADQNYSGSYIANLAYYDSTGTSYIMNSLPINTIFRRGSTYRTEISQKIAWS